MALTALLFAHHGAGHDGEPPAALPIAGVSIIERQVAEARAHGASRVLVVVERMPPMLALALDRADVEIVRAATGFQLASDDRVVVLADSLLVDRRIVAAVLNSRAPTLAVWRGRGAHDGAERLDPTSHWAGVALYSGEMVATTLAELGEWDLQATLLRAAYADGKPSRIDVGALDISASPLAWAPIRTAEEAAMASRAEVAAGDVEVRDWPSRLLHARIEARVVPNLLARQMTISPILAAAMGFAFIAVVAFAAGYPWVALISAIVSGPLFAIARRLARVRRDEGRAARLIEPAVMAAEAAWCAALAAWFSASHELVAPWAVAALILTGAGGIISARAAYRRLTNRALDETGPFEQRLRAFGGQGNALLWSLLPFAALGLWWPGYVAVAVYALCTFLLTGWRLYVRLSQAQAPPAANRRISPAPAVHPSPRMFEPTDDETG